MNIKIVTCIEYCLALFEFFTLENAQGCRCFIPSCPAYSSAFFSILCLTKIFWRLFLLQACRFPEMARRRSASSVGEEEYASRYAQLGETDRYAQVGGQTERYAEVGQAGKGAQKKHPDKGEKKHLLASTSFNESMRSADTAYSSVAGEATSRRSESAYLALDQSTRIESEYMTSGKHAPADEHELEYSSLSHATREPPSTYTKVTTSGRESDYTEARKLSGAQSNEGAYDSTLVRSDRGAGDVYDSTLNTIDENTGGYYDSTLFEAPKKSSKDAYANLQGDL